MILVSILRRSELNVKIEPSDGALLPRAKQPIVDRPTCSKPCVEIRPWTQPSQAPWGRPVCHCACNNTVNRAHSMLAPAPFKPQDPRCRIGGGVAWVRRDQMMRARRESGLPRQDRALDVWTAPPQSGWRHFRSSGSDPGSVRPSSASDATSP